MKQTKILKNKGNLEKKTMINIKWALIFSIKNFYVNPVKSEKLEVLILITFYYQYLFKYFFSAILIYISQTNICINTLKKEKKAIQFTIQQKNKTYTILDPTLKQVMVRLHSSAAYIDT